MDVKWVVEVDRRQGKLSFRTKEVETEQVSNQELKARTNCP